MRTFNKTEQEIFDHLQKANDAVKGTNWWETFKLPTDFVAFAYYRPYSKRQETACAILCHEGYLLEPVKGTFIKNFRSPV